MTKRALITGITGQDGSYLAELLLSKGYEVYGIVRRSSTLNRKNIDHLQNESSVMNSRFKLLYGDLTDANSISKILHDVKPDEVYNLGAQSHVRVSFDVPVYTADTIALGTLRLLEAIRQENTKIKFYQASSSEMYGKVLEIPQKENTPFNPRSPYACAKVFAHQITKLYRDSYNMFACGGILFNHESPRRGDTFVTKKIVKAVVQIKLGKQKELYLGNLESKETGVMLLNMLKQCGVYFSRKNQMISLLQLEKHTQLKNLSKKHLTMLISTGKITLK